MKTYVDRVGVERCATCYKPAGEQLPSEAIYAAAMRALRYFDNQVAGKPNGLHEDQLCGQELTLALAKLRQGVSA